MHTLVSSKTQLAVDSFIKSPSHSVIVSGPEGSGKFSIAQTISDTILADAKNHGSVEVIDGDIDGTIEQVRVLQKFFKLKVVGSKSIRRVVIIKSLDNFGAEAQNALLKLIEEPPLDSLIIVTATSVQKVLPTLMSRMSQIHVYPVTMQQAQDQYSDKWDQAAISRAYMLSSGSAVLLDALLEDPETHPLATSIEQAKSLLVLDKYHRLLEVDKLSKQENSSVRALISSLESVIRASLLYAKNLSPSQAKKRIQQLEALEEAARHLSANVQTKLVLSSLFSKL